MANPVGMKLTPWEWNQPDEARIGYFISDALVDVKGISA